MKARILVMNHSPEILAILHDLLEDEGYEVKTAEVRLEHLIAIEQTHPDLIILDGLFGQPPTGWMLLKHMKANTVVATIPVILCTTAVREVNERKACLQQLGIPVLFKPFEIDELLELVRQVLVPDPHQLL